jgi:hypothetical protein
MQPTMKAKIERNHELAAAMCIIVAFTERPACVGGPLEIDEAIAEIVRQGSYHVTTAQMEAEWNRISALQI